METRAVYNKIFILMLSLPLLVSCAAKDFTESSIAANIVDKCFQATKDLVV